MKNKANVVVIGGGVVGCSIAYNLALQGISDVVLIEKSFLASGSTGRCGAGVRQQWGTKMNCLLAQKSMEILENMNDILHTKRDIELKQKGYLLLAYTEKEMNQFKKNVELQNSLGIASKIITPAQAREIVPYLNTEKLLGGAFYEKDGHANPFLVTNAYAQAAISLGAEVNTYTEVVSIKRNGSKIEGVQTSKGFISTDTVIDAAGGYSKEIGKMAGVDIPVYPQRHQILVTDPVDEVLGPMVMSFSYNIYCQQSPQGSFIMGYGDPTEPRDYNINSSWRFLEEMAEKAVWLLPPLKNLRVVRQWSGLYTMTEDRQPLICKADEAENFYMACGFSGHGFMIAPMVGKLISEMVIGKKLSIDIELNYKRFEKGELLFEPSVV
ncbi:MAG TPA: FAD-binding oxidoreductase [Petrotogaceae bacterium]|jgi:sarcosine oxidase subunit beta|nr:FAD-binding oxidoreductase [Petrotogaceae bacterium]HOG34727.1 FAD-binding oxidoreductase [Petrotogaceae bacterium]HPA93475.1 FAD-binding oxidoreductase [Petrotogaceae bacterium]HPG47735.1 FAD-binding oxidoreductase [Petrotogaceae bacterium]HPO27364.1 FAD-binding oxidoreductase [Petrotogaceae bacterium]